MGDDAHIINSSQQEKQHQKRRPMRLPEKKVQINKHIRAKLWLYHNINLKGETHHILFWELNGPYM